MGVVLRALLVLALSSSTLAAVSISSANVLKRFGEQRRAVTSALASSRSGHHHVQHDDECGDAPAVYDKYEFSPCFECFHHVMHVKGVTVNDQGEEVEKLELGTIANKWLHNGLPATHLYDTEGLLVAVLWSTILSTPEDNKEFVVLADCHDNTLWEVEGDGYTKVLGWGVLRLENNTKIDFSADSWGDEDDVVEEESGKTVIKITNWAGGTTTELTEFGADIMPLAADDSRIFILLMGTSILRVTSASPWTLVTMVIIPLIVLCCCCGCVCYGIYYCFFSRRDYEPIPNSKAMD